jgi:hypothetical protein
MKIEGACHCGQITYEAEADPEMAGICNCTDCQTLSGSAFRTIVLVPGESFRILTGSPKIYLKVGDSGAERVQAFCDTCGSPIYSASSDQHPKEYSIRLGTVRQRRELEPRFQIWRRSALSWLGRIDSIPAKDGQ